MSEQRPSLEEFNGSVALPPENAPFWRQFRAFAGPAFLVSVGYMDPGNWGTDLKAGALFRYDLLWVVALSSLMAIVMQVLSARLGIVTGKDLAQASRDFFPRWLRIPQWLACEIAIAACDLAEILGSAIAINLVFHIPLLAAIAITVLDVLLLLGLQGLGMRFLEALVLSLVAIIGGCYFIEIFVLPPTRPDFGEMGRALLSPTLARDGMALCAIGIIGATVMPHNLYLHSALVQSRKLRLDDGTIRRAIWYYSFDTILALTMAFFVNAAILVLAANVFYGREGATLANGTFVPFNDDTDWIRDAYLTLAPLLGTTAAAYLFALALFASGQSSTITGTLAGQVVMEGFLHWKMRPWVRRLITRLVAVLPVLLVVGFRPDWKVNDLLVISQVVLALQLPLAMLPLLLVVSSRKRMGTHRPSRFLLAAGWSSFVVISVLDIYGLVLQAIG